MFKLIAAVALALFFFAAEAAIGEYGNRCRHPNVLRANLPRCDGGLSCVIVVGEGPTCMPVDSVGSELYCINATVPDSDWCVEIAAYLDDGSGSGSVVQPYQDPCPSNYTRGDCPPRCSNNETVSYPEFWCPFNGCDGDLCCYTPAGGDNTCFVY